MWRAWAQIGRTLTRRGWGVVLLGLLGLLALSLWLALGTHAAWRWCEPGEIGDWVLGTDATLYLARVPAHATAEDIRCQVRPTAQILVLGTGKEL